MSASWKRALLMAFSVAGAVGVLALFAFGLGRDARAIPSPLPGRPAPDFALEVLFAPRPPVGSAPQPGDSVRLKALRGNVVVINFWASWCLACRHEHAELSRAAQRYRDRRVSFFGILSFIVPSLLRAIGEPLGRRIGPEPPPRFGAGDRPPDGLPPRPHA